MHVSLIPCTLILFYSCPQNDLRSSLILLKHFLQGSKIQQLPSWFTLFLKRLVFLAAFAAVFIALRLYLMKSAPKFQEYVTKVML